ncbi:Protein DP71L [Orchesella cincta]|uniref:Protein DP71L n=1 Tax=Orchesella cincta TaxID=48709 RepID=A0A1D2MYI7_ORCCI|nr:Protein DP71L [Orchesella cincta]
MISEDYGDRRSPVMFEAKKVCMDMDVNESNSAAIISSSTVIRHARKAPKEKKIKSVRFKEENLAEVIEFEDDIESKNNRKLYWESVAADRFRFKDRIERLQEILSPVLNSSHRNVVYTHRVMKTTTTSLPLFGSILPVSASLVEEVGMVVIQKGLETRVQSLLQYDSAIHSGIGAGF